MSVLAITGPVYAVIALGYACTRAGLFERADMRVFGKFVIYLALPALLFNALSQRSVAEVLNPVFIAAYASGSVAANLLGFLWARRFAGKPVAESAIVGMGMSCPNSGFIGFPLVAQLFGPANAGVALALAMLVENLLMLPLSLAILLRRAVAVRIGGSLARLQLRGVRRDVAVIAAGKLLLHPLLVLGAVLLLPPMARELQVIVVLMAAVPMLGIYPILAQRHGHDGMAAAAQLGTTVASFFTLTAAVGVVQYLR